MQHLPGKTKWTVYGKYAMGLGSKGLTREFFNEADAVAYLLERALNAPTGSRVDAVVARVDKYRVDHNADVWGRSVGKYKDVPTVILRLGNGKGWWER